MVCVCGRPVRPPIDTSLIYGLMTDEAKHRGQPLVSDVHFNEKGGYSGRLCWANEPCTPHPATGWLRKAYAFNNAPHFATRYLYVHNVLLLLPRATLAGCAALAVRVPCAVHRPKRLLRRGRGAQVLPSFPEPDRPRKQASVALAELTHETMPTLCFGPAARPLCVFAILGGAASEAPPAQLAEVASATGASLVM